MGRPRKLKPGDVAWYPKPVEGEDGEEVKVRQYCVIVDYYRNEDPTHAGYYIVVPTTSQHTQMVVTGSTRWIKSNYLTKIDTDYTMKTIVSRYRNNTELGRKDERGCHCHCCIHVAVPPSHVIDGQFSWDFEEGEDE